jgi:hypothetical protein
LPSRAFFSAMPRERVMSLALMPVSFVRFRRTWVKAMRPVRLMPPIRAAAIFGDIVPMLFTRASMSFASTVTFGTMLRKRPGL